MGNIRFAEKEDIPSLSRQEKECFSDPWSESALEDFFRLPHGLILIYEEEGKIIGSLIASLLAGEGEILRVATAKEKRGRGIGTLLMTALLEEGKKRGIEAFFLEVREKNLAARTLYEKTGFQKSGRRKNYYRFPTEDACLYQIQVKKDTKHENSCL